MAGPTRKVKSLVQSDNIRLRYRRQRRRSARLCVGHRRLHGERSDVGGRPHSLHDDRPARRTRGIGAAARAAQRPRRRGVSEGQDRPGRFELRADAAVVVGIDAGRLHITTIVADLRGGELAREHADPGAGPRFGRRAPRGRRSGGEPPRWMPRAARPSHVLAICAGVPAPVDRAGASPPHWDDFWQRMNPDLVELFPHGFPSCGWRTTRPSPPWRRARSALRSGTGTTSPCSPGSAWGAGVVVDGTLLRGAHGGVGEMVAFDHVIGVEGAFGLGYRAAQWAREAVAAGDVSPESPLSVRRRRRTSTDAPCCKAALAGDPDAPRVADRVSGMLGIVAGMFGSLFDPRLVVVSRRDLGGRRRGGGRRAGVAPLASSTCRRRWNSSPPTLGGDVVCIGAVAAALEVGPPRGARPRAAGFVARSEPASRGPPWAFASMSPLGRHRAQQHRPKWDTGRRVFRPCPHWAATGRSEAAQVGHGWRQRVAGADDAGSAAAAEPQAPAALGRGLPGVRLRGAAGRGIPPFGPLPRALVDVDRGCDDWRPAEQGRRASITRRLSLPGLAHVGLPRRCIEPASTRRYSVRSVSAGGPRPVSRSRSILRRIHQSGSCVAPRPGIGLPAPGEILESPRRIACWIEASTRPARPAG